MGVPRSWSSGRSQSRDVPGCAPTPTYTSRLPSGEMASTRVDTRLTSPWLSARARLTRSTSGSGTGRSHPASAAPVAMTAAVATSAKPRREMPALVPPPAPLAAIAPVVNAGSESASANAFALSNRSAGSFSMALATAAATLGGTLFRSAVTACAGSVMIFMMICCAVAPVCGGFPVSIS